VEPFTQATLDDARATPRELEVLAALADRLMNAEIAEKLGVSERTVESHVSSLLRKLKAANRRELSAFAKRLDAFATVRPTCQRRPRAESGMWRRLHH
jgi:DNA-binding NarL/FixJ family response regulator